MVSREARMTYCAGIDPLLTILSSRGRVYRRLICREKETSLSPVSEPRKTVEEIIESIDSEDVREIVREREAEIVRRLEDWASEVADTQ